MNAQEIVKLIVEAEHEDEFDPIDYIKRANSRETAVEIYNGPLVRVIQPLAAYTLNQYLHHGNEIDPKTFAQFLQEGPLYLAVDKANHENLAIFQPSTNRVWGQDGRERTWKDIPEMINERGGDDKNWLDLQQGLATHFMAQIARKKNVGQWVKFLTMIGRTDLATNYARYLGRAKLPFGKSIDAVLAMKKAGKRSRNRIARLMKNQENVKWGEQGFWLLFNDWVDLAPFYGESREYDYAKNAEKIFSGDTFEWFEGASTDPADVWSQINDRNMNYIRQLLVNRTVYNSDGEEHLVTPENIEELTDDEIKDIVCDRGNKHGEAEDIYDAIRSAADDEHRSSQEAAYYNGYRNALMKQWGLQEDKTIKWMKVGKKPGGHQKEMLALWFPYSTLEEWIAQWKEDEYEDDFFGDIHELAAKYLEKVEPNDEYWGNGDADYFNETLGERLHEIKLTNADKSDPNQPELALQGEPAPKQRELEQNYSVHVGEPPNEKVYKGVPKADATKYREAMKPKRDDIFFRGESFLAIPLDERAGDLKIEFEATKDAAASLVPLLKELRKMGNQGSSRDITIDDWDGRTSFGFDGDGNAKIGEIKVDGHVAENAENFDDEDIDPKSFAKRTPHVEHFMIQVVGVRHEYPNTAFYLMGVAQWTPHPWQATEFSYREAEAKAAQLASLPSMQGLNVEVVPMMSGRDRPRESLQESQAQFLAEAIYKRSTTQIDIPKEIGQHIISWGELNIADEDLYLEEDGGCGRETEQHITVLYGLTDPTPPEALTHIVESTKPFLIEFGGVSVFENEKYDVIKLDVISEELENLSMEIRRSCPNENKFPTYIPHCTIAYVKPGLGKKYAGQDVFKAAEVPRDFWAYDLKFKGAGDSEDGQRVVQLISFDKSKDSGEPEEPEAGEQRYPEATREEPELAVAESAEDPEGRAKLLGHLQDIGLEPVPDDELKAILARNVPMDCPECHSRNLSSADEEGLVDCYNCGIWFDPFHPANKPVAESEEGDIDPKRFAARTTGYDLGEWTLIEEEPKRVVYRHKGGRVQFETFYLGRGRWRTWVTSVPDGKAMSDWEDYRADSLENAVTTGMNIAFELIHNTDGSLFRPVQEDQELINAKEFINRATNYRIRRGAGPNTKYLQYDQGTGAFTWGDYDDATVFNAQQAGEMLEWVEQTYGDGVVAELDDEGHPSSHMESEEIEPKSFAMRADVRFVVRSNHNPPMYLKLVDENSGSEFGSARTTSDKTKATQFSAGAAQTWADHLNGGGFEHYRFEPVMTDMLESVGPFDEDGLPGEVTTFLRKVRSKRRQKREQSKPAVI